VLLRLFFRFTVNENYDKSRLGMCIYILYKTSWWVIVELVMRIKL